MLGRSKYSLDNIFHIDEKEKQEEQQKNASLQKTVNNVYGKTSDDVSKSYNPFLNKNGELFNPYLNYQKILDNSNVSQTAKNYITQATGLTPTQSTSYEEHTESSNVQSVFNPNLDGSTLGSLDVRTELPKLDESQISKIISQHFNKSTVISPSDAKGIYEAQK